MIAYLTHQDSRPLQERTSLANAVGGCVGGYQNHTTALAAFESDHAPSHRQHAGSRSYHYSVTTVSELAGCCVEQHDVSGIGIVNQTQRKYPHLKAARRV